MHGNLTTAFAVAGPLLFAGGQSPGNSFPWALVAILVGGTGVLAVGGYLVARFLANHHRKETEGQ